MDQGEFTAFYHETAPALRIGSKTISLTMRTPGHDFELAAGFLFTEGILSGFQQIHKIRRSESSANPRQAGNSVTVELNPDVEVDYERLQRHFYTTSSCGVCGKASIEAIETQGCPVLPRNSPLVDSAVIHRLPDRKSTRLNSSYLGISYAV